MNTAARYAKSLQGAEPQASDSTPPPLARILESLLFAGERPLTIADAAKAIPGITDEQFHAAIDELNRMYRRQKRPYGVERRRDGFALSLKAGLAELKQRLTGGPRQARLTVPMLDVLAIVAYKQPVTRNEIDALRGEDSASALRHLVRLSIISLQNATPGLNEPAYNTTSRFLELFGLQSLDDLPQTADLQKI